MSSCDRCKIELVESIPEGLVYNSTIDNLRTHDAWLRYDRETIMSVTYCELDRGVYQLHAYSDTLKDWRLTRSLGWCLQN